LFGDEAMRRQIINGQKFNNLIFIKHEGRMGKKNRHAGLFKCKCGKEKIIIIDNVVSGNSKTCGCVKKKHGMEGTKIYRLWGGMIARCNNPKKDNYFRYGGRGIKVCDRWMDFSNFYKDMGDKPSSKHQLDRIDNNRNYSHDNCHWVLPVENIRKKDSTKLNVSLVKEIKSHIKDKALKNIEISNIYNVSQATICDIKAGRTWSDVEL